jgi:hypothetical protein
MFRIALQPNYPKSVKIGMVKPEDGIEWGGIEGTHPTGWAAHRTVHGVVRNSLTPAGHAASVTEARSAASESRRAACAVIDKERLAKASGILRIRRGPNLVTAVCPIDSLRNE